MPFAGLIEVGEFSYDGIVFEGANRIRVRETPIRDDAQRTVSYVQYDISITTVLYESEPAATPTTDAQMAEYREKLSKDQKRLIFKSKGYGIDLDIDKTLDVKFGPRVSVLSWTPVGSNRACEIEWAVTTCVKECGGNNHEAARVMSYNYSIGSSYDERGDLTRRISGYLEVANNWVDAVEEEGGGLIRSPDEHRDLARFEPMPGFIRTTSFDLAAAKSRLNFTIIDKQVSSPRSYPLGMIAAEGTQQVVWARPTSGGSGALSFQVTINVRLDPRHGFTAGQAYLYFHALVSERRYQMGLAGSYVLLTGLNITENLWGYPLSASASFRVFGCLNTIVQQTALFTAIPQGGSWSDWAADMNLSGHMFNEGGYVGGSTHNAASDKKPVNACSDMSIIDRPALKIPIIFEANTQTAAFANTVPPKLNSFMKFKLNVFLHSQRPVALQQILQAKDEPHGVENLAESTDEYSLGGATGTAHVLQTGGTAICYATILGDISRAHWPISRPKITQIHGVDAEEIWSSEMLSVEGNYNGVVVNRLRFITAYALKERPGVVSRPADLSDCIPESTGQTTQTENPPQQ